MGVGSLPLGFGNGRASSPAFRGHVLPSRCCAGRPLRREAPCSGPALLSPPGLSSCLVFQDFLEPKTLGVVGTQVILAEYKGVCYN